LQYGLQIKLLFQPKTQADNNNANPSQAQFHCKLYGGKRKRKAVVICVARPCVVILASMPLKPNLNCQFNDSQRFWQLFFQDLPATHYRQNPTKTLSHKRGG